MAATKQQRSFTSALGEANLTGWRDRVARPVAGAVSSRTRVSEEQVRVLIGLAFTALAAYAVLSTVRRAFQIRQGSAR